MNDARGYRDVLQRDAIEFMEGLWRMAAMVILSQRKRWSGICDERE